MRIWDIEPNRLCRKHLLGEHRELHAIWSVIANNKAGYSKHPETKRWVGKFPALYRRHQALVEEMSRRGYRHHSPLMGGITSGETIQDTFVDSIDAQYEILKTKNCDCITN